jgi:hypothetical protein
VPHAIFEVIAEYPEEKHVAEDVRDAAVHEHRSKQREIDTAGRRLQARLLEAVAAHRVLHDARRGYHIAPGRDLLRHG